MKKKNIYFLSTLIMLVFLTGLGGIIHLNNRPKISVIMSTYNRAYLLPKAIDSILNQTFSDFELIIINDGSHDKTNVVLKEYQQKDKRIKVIKNQTNLGLIESLNKGLAFANGRYIARMDDDDLSVPTRFERQLEYMEKHPDITVTGTTQYAYDKNFFVPVQKVWVEADADELAVFSHYNVPILHPSAMIRSGFIKKHGIRYQKGYDSAEDTPFWHSIVRKGGKIVRLAPPLVVNSLDSPKKEGYYGKQIVSFGKFLNDSLKEVRGDYQFQSRWLDHNELCFILQQLKNQQVSYYSSKEAERLFNKENCVASYEVLNKNGENVIVAVDKTK